MSKHIGRPCRVYWKNDNEWFHGVIDEYHVEKGWHCQYYDGDDEWLPKLDGATILFDDEDRARDGGAIETSLESALSQWGKNRGDAEDSDGGEVVVVQNDVDGTGDYADKGEDDEDDGNRAVQLQLDGAFDLPERGVLLLGSVTGASNLPATMASMADGGGEVFFRVLYVEVRPAPGFFTRPS